MFLMFLSSNYCYITQAISCSLTLVFLHTCVLSLLMLLILFNYSGYQMQPDPGGPAHLCPLPAHAINFI